MLKAWLLRWSSKGYAIATDTMQYILYEIYLCQIWKIFSFEIQKRTFTMNTVYYIDNAASCIRILFTVRAEHACSFLNPNHIGVKYSFIIVRGEGSTLSYVFILTYFFYFELKLYVIFMTKAVSN